MTGPGTRREPPEVEVASSPDDGAGGGERHHLAALARSGGINILGSAVSGVLSFVLVLLITRGFSGGDAGSFFALQSIFLIVLAALELGASTGLVKWLPHHLALRAVGDLRTCLRVALVPVAAVSAAVALVVLALPEVAAGLVGEDAAPGLVDAARVLALFLPVAALYNVVLSGTRGFGSIRPTVVVERLGRSIAQPAAVGVAVLLGTGVAGLALAWSLPYLGALALAVLYLVVPLRRAEAQDAGGDGASRPAGQVAREFWGYTWMRGVSRMLQVALQRIDIPIVAALRSPEEAALYTAATRLVPLGLLGVQAVQQVMEPVLSRLMATGDRLSADQLFRTSTVWVMALSWPPFLAAAAMAPFVLEVFGEGYEAAATALVLVSLSMLVGTGSGATDVVLLMAGRSGLSLGNNVVALSLNLALNFALVPRLGITGAAIAWGSAIVVNNLLSLVQVRRGLAMSPFSRGAAWIAGASVVCFGLGPWAATQLVQDLGLGGAAGVLAVGAAAYAAVLWRVREDLHVDVLRAAVARRAAG